MDLFAAILITITAVTICGICLFIFVCALQPQFLRKLHGKTSRSYQANDSNASSHEDEDHLSVKSLDVTLTTTELKIDNPSSILQSNNRDKKAYLKSLEQSLRTGKRMQSEGDTEDTSHSGPFSFISRFINKYIRRRTNETNENIEL